MLHIFLVAVGFDYCKLSNVEMTNLPRLFLYQYYWLQCFKELWKLLKEKISCDLTQKGLKGHWTSDHWQQSKYKACSRYLLHSAKQRPNEINLWRDVYFYIISVKMSVIQSFAFLKTMIIPFDKNEGSLYVQTTT